MYPTLSFQLTLVEYVKFNPTLLGRQEIQRSKIVTTKVKVHVWVGFIQESPQYVLKVTAGFSPSSLFRIPEWCENSIEGHQSFTSDELFSDWGSIPPRS